MFKILEINKPYIICEEKVTDLSNNDFVFSQKLKSLSNIYEKTDEETIRELYPFYDENDENVQRYCLKKIKKKFGLIDPVFYNNIKEKIKLDDNIIIKLYNSINNNIIIDFIGKLTLYYKKVYLVNCVYDNPIDTIFYIVCIKRNSNNQSETANRDFEQSETANRDFEQSETANRNFEQSETANRDFEQSENTIELSTNDFITNINKNKENIFIYLYSCYYTTIYLLKCLLRSSAKHTSTYIYTLNIYHNRFKNIYLS